MGPSAESRPLASSRHGVETALISSTLSKAPRTSTVNFSPESTVTVLAE
jgi:hypothetical protein